MDGRKNNKGQKGNKGGRPGKAEEQKLIENLTPMNPKALKALEENIDEGEAWAVKLFFEYFYGKPKETRDINIKEIPVIDMSEWK